MTLVELEIDGLVTKSEWVADCALRQRIKMFSALGFSSHRPYAVFTRVPSKKLHAPSRVSPEKRAEIKKLYGPLTYQEISERTGVSTQTVMRIISK